MRAGEAYERLLAFNALVQGETLQGWILADLASAVDLLSADARVERRASVSASRWAASGHLLDALRRSLRAGVASCGLSRLRFLVDRRCRTNAALYVPGLLPDLDFERCPGDRPAAALRHRRQRDVIYPVDGVRDVERAAARLGPRRAPPIAALPLLRRPPRSPGRSARHRLAWLQGFSVSKLALRRCCRPRIRSDAFRSAESGLHGGRRAARRSRLDAARRTPE